MPSSPLPLRLGAILLIASCAIASLWLSATLTRQRAVEALAERGEQALTLFTANLESEVEKYAFLPQVLATDNIIVRALKTGVESLAARRANQLLADINRIAHTSDTYIMRPDGNTIAASNHDQPHSFVGRNFGFRPYFQDAIAGRQGRYFALGTTSKKRGYYFSAPVYDDEDDSIIGAAVVKVQMDRLEAAWRDSDVLTLLTDAHGVIFSASREDWQLRTLAPLPDALRVKIFDSRQYINQPLKPLPVLDRNEYDGRASLRIEADGGGSPNRYLIQRTELPRSEWIALALSDTIEVERQVRFAVVLNLLAIVVLLMLGAFWLNWQRHQRQRAAMREQTARLLRAERDQLDARVQLRTRELSDSNEELQREIGEHRRTTEELKLAQVELVQAGKLAALGQLSAGITHEINQPLTAIRTYATNARALLDRGRSAEAADNLTDISELTERMAQITGHLKTYARKSDGQLTSVPLAQNAQRALSLLKMKAQRQGAEIQIDIDPSLCVRADDVRLEQVLLNLFNNALDAMRHSHEHRLEIRADRLGEQVVVSVRDTGPGIDTEHIDKLFDPFFTTKGVGDGLGLGLSISYSIVKQFDGKLAASNHPEGGALFTLSLRHCNATADLGETTP